MESGSPREEPTKPTKKRTTCTSFASDHCTPQSSGLRLIPLTPQVVTAMMEFNGSQSSTSISDKPFYNTFSITSLVREEVHNILQELCVTDQFIRKEEIDALVERCLREKVTVDPQESKTTTTSSESMPDANQEIEVTVEVLNESDKNKLIVENFQILEQRITNLEERVSTVLQTVPKLRHLQARRFKLNTSVIREELGKIMDKMEASNRKDGAVPEQKNLSDGQPLSNDTVTTDGDGANSAETVITEPINLYNDLYYVQRQNAMNILNYKKSAATMELNERPYVSPYIKPIKHELGDTTFKAKQKPVFITE